MRLVGSAGDAEEAIALAETIRPDVAIVDVKMPAGGGPRAARGIMQASPDTRVIALSAHEDRETVLEMLRAGAVSYLVKGTAPDEIVRSIGRAAQGQASLSSEVMDGIVHELTTKLRREEVVTVDRLALQARVRRLIDGDGLAMHFQPIIELATGRAFGGQKLDRRRSLQHGVVRLVHDAHPALADLLGQRVRPQFVVARLRTRRPGSIPTDGELHHEPVDLVLAA